MAQKAELEARESECGNAADFAVLANEALTEPADLDYAKHLAQQGEMQCQFPIDYLQIAEVAFALGESEQADELFQQAEDFCMEGSEFAQVAASLATYTEQKDRAAELLEKAVSQASQPEEFINYAKVAADALNNKVLATKLMDKVREKCPDLDSFKALAKKILTEKQDTATAKEVYQNASSLVDGPEGVAQFAVGIIELFEDQKWAEESLAAVEGDCMFPNQFVAVATAYKTLLDSADKASELLEQGKQFAMSGEENLDLANGYSDLLDDKETAQALYQQALSDFVNKDDLLRLAEAAAARLDDNDLAKEAYKKAEDKMADANDLLALAKSIHTYLSDKELVAAIYAKANERLSNAIELVRLAGEVFHTLGDEELTRSVYQKALEVAADYPALEKILQSLESDFKDETLAHQVLEKVMAISGEASELLAAAKRSNQLLGESPVTLKLLDLTEESVKALDDLRQLVRAAEALAASDKPRIQRLKAKLEKREASQARYVEFQDREKILTRPSEFTALAGEVMGELDDPAYASKLLQNALEQMDESPFELQPYLRLLVAVDSMLNDADWINRLLQQCAENCQYYVQIRSLGQCACGQLANFESGVEWTKALYLDWEKRLADQSAVSSYELSKLAAALRSDVTDNDGAMRCLELARNCATDHFQLLHLAAIASGWGEVDLAADLYREAAGRCTTAEAFTQLVQKLKTQQAPESLQRKLYEMGSDSLADPMARLRWAEGILQLFNDREWATTIYQSLEGGFSDDTANAVYQNSMKVNLFSLR